MDKRWLGHLSPRNSNQKLESAVRSFPLSLIPCFVCECQGGYEGWKRGRNVFHHDIVSGDAVCCDEEERGVVRKSIDIADFSLCDERE